MSLGKNYGIKVLRYSYKKSVYRKVLTMGAYSKNTISDTISNFTVIDISQNIIFQKLYHIRPNKKVCVLPGTRPTQKIFPRFSDPKHFFLSFVLKFSFLHKNLKFIIYLLWPTDEPRGFCYSIIVFVSVCLWLFVCVCMSV